MALATTPPADIPTTDTLANIPADLLGPIPAELRVGANVLTIMEKPPELGDTVTVTVRLRVTREGKEKASGDADGEIRHFRGCKIVAAWLKGQPEPPEDDTDDVPMINTDGSINEDAAEGDDDETDNVARPDFSDGSK